MLKFISKVKIEFNPMDPRIAPCMEILAQCSTMKAKESSPSCKVLVKRRTDDHPPQVTVTFADGTEDVYDAASTDAHTIRTTVMEKGSYLETEHMFREAGEPWPLVIPADELHEPPPRTKPRVAKEKKQ